MCGGGGAGGGGGGGKSEKGDKQVFLILRLQLDEYSNAVSVTCDPVIAPVVVIIVVVVMRFSGGGGSERSGYSRMRIYSTQCV